MTSIPARTRVHSGGKKKISWVGNVPMKAGYCYEMILKGLAERFGNGTRELGEFVEK